MLNLTDEQKNKIKLNKEKVEKLAAKQEKLFKETLKIVGFTEEDEKYMDEMDNPVGDAMLFLFDYTYNDYLTLEEVLEKLEMKPVAKKAQNFRLKTAISKDGVPPMSITVMDKKDK